MSAYPKLVETRRKWDAAYNYEFVPGLTCQSPCPSPYTGNVTDQIRAVDSVLLGFSDYNWRSIIKAGSQAGSTLSGTRHYARPSQGGYYYALHDPGSCCSYGAASGSYEYEGFPLVSPFPNSTADSKARGKLLESYVRAKTSWRGGNFIAEFKETVHMLKNPVYALRNHCQTFIDEVRRVKGYWRNQRRYAQLVGNAWLSFVFGWRPLFEDIKDANRAVADLNTPFKHDTKRIMGAGGDQTQRTLGGGGSSLYINSYCLYDRWEVSDFQQKYYGAIVARPSFFGQVPDTFGISGYDIAPAIWEAIPWSFLIDYFVNVNEMIDAMRYATADLAWLMGGYKNTVTVTQSGWYNRADLPNYVESSPGVAGAQSRSVFKSRAPLLSLPYPTFRFKIPGFGSAKWINIGALIASIEQSRPNYAKPPKGPRKCKGRQCWRFGGGLG